MQSLLRTCYEPLTLLRRLQSGTAEWAIAQALRNGALGTSNTGASSTWLWASQKDDQKGLIVESTHIARHAQRKVSVLTSRIGASYNLSARQTRQPFSFNHDLLRQYSVSPDIALSEFSQPLADQLTSLRDKTFSDAELRELWRDILESFGDGEPGLPVVGDDADKIWTSLISLGTRDETIMHEICDYSDRLWDRERRERPTLYADVVGALFRCQNYTDGLWYHDELSRKLEIGEADLLKVLRDGCPRTVDIPYFQELCLTLKEHHFYDQIISYLCAKSRFGDAMQMHTFLLQRKDYPKDLNGLRHLHIFATSMGSATVNSFQAELKKARIDVSDDALLAGFSDGNEGLSDDFVARLIATESFSLDLVFQSLRKFHATKLGPLAVQQICLRTKSIPNMAECLDALSEYDISFESSKYIRLIRKAVSNGEHFLFAQACSNDLQPGTLDNLQYLKTLLINQYHSGDDRQMQFTRAVLRLHGFHDDKTYNYFLRDDLGENGGKRDWKKATRTLATMAEQDIPVFYATLHWLIQSPLHLRRLPRINPLAAADFVTILWQTTDGSGKKLPPYYWKAMIKLLGLSKRLADLRHMVISLASLDPMEKINKFRAPSHLHPQAGEGPRSLNFASLALLSKPLREAYPMPLDVRHSALGIRLQRDLIIWGFLHAANEWVLAKPRSLEDVQILADIPSPTGWSFGLQLLKIVRQQEHIWVSDQMVRDSVLYRLRALLHKDALLSMPERWQLVQKLAKDSNKLWESELLPESEQELADILFARRKLSLHWESVLEELPHLGTSVWSPETVERYLSYRPRTSSDDPENFSMETSRVERSSLEV